MTSIRCLTCQSTAVISTPNGGYCGHCDAFVFVYLNLDGWPP